MWLFKKYVLTFSAPIKYAKTKFNPIILSRIIEYTTYYYRQKDRQTLWRTQSSNNMNKKSINDFWIVLIMILWYLLSFKVSKLIQ